MTDHRSLLAALLFLPGFAFGVAASAEEPPAPAAPAAAPATTPAAPLASQYTEKGADTCVKCHDEDSVFPVYSIFKTKHAQMADKRTPFAGLQCEACHGPGAAHAKSVPEGQKQGPIIKFGVNSRIPVAKQNQICLGCHSGNDRMDWTNSVHEVANVACVSCHRIHAPRDPVLAKATQPEVCETCHRKVQADFLKASVHPVRAGLMACSDCHNPHGSNTRALLVKPTVNQTCYTCHAEKRGPFLWEHAPVAEDCTICHTPHGSVYSALLKTTPPLLCQQCHGNFGHPAVALDGSVLPGGSNAAASGFLVAGSCTNCHSEVHGSNHPSGVRLMR
jgi:DmsE family decaheme c-type cytochrome